MTSLAPVHRRLRKVIVDSIDSRVSEQGGEIQKRFSAQKCLFSRHDVRGGRREHPHRNLQPAFADCFGANSVASA